MRVAVIVPGGVDPSGTHRVIPCLLWLLERISEAHDVHVFAMRGHPRARSYTLRGATVHDVPGTGRRTLPTLRTLLGEHRRGPFGLLHAFWASGPGLVAALARPLIRRPVLLHLPGGDLVSIHDIGYGGRVDLAGRFRVRLALAAAGRLTAPSLGIRDAAAALGQDVERLPLGVSRDDWPPRTPRARRPDEPARIIHVGTLNRVKDPATLLRAARSMADAGLDFTLDQVGADTLDGAMGRLADRLGLRGRVRFHGFLPQSELRPLVAGAHLMLVSSRHEAGPVAAAEAAMVGVPTVGTAVGQLPEWAPEAAAVVPVGDATGLADAALRLLGDDPRRLRTAAAAQAIALAEDADRSARRVLALYHELTHA